MRRQIAVSARPLAVIAALFLIYASPLHAEARITGTPDALQIEAHESSIEEMLNILATRFGLRYRTEASLDRLITGTYKGTLQQVVGRLLEGFDYIAKTNSGGVEIIILRDSNHQPAPQVPVVTRRRAD